MGFNGPAPKKAAKAVMIGGPLDGRIHHSPAFKGRSTTVWSNPETNRFHRYRWSGAVWEYDGAATADSWCAELGDEKGE